jgi:hypothetical protein
VTNKFGTKHYFIEILSANRHHIPRAEGPIPVQSRLISTAAQSASVAKRLGQALMTS